MSIIRLQVAVIQAKDGCRPGIPDFFDLDNAGPFGFPCCNCLHRDADLEVAPCKGCRHYAN